MSTTHHHHHHGGNPTITAEVVGQLPSNRSDTAVATAFGEFQIDRQGPTYNHLIFITGGCNARQSWFGDGPFPGYYCTSITNNVVAFDPMNETVVAQWDAPVPRYRHVAAVVHGHLFLIGGRDLNDAPVTSVDVLNLNNFSWSTISGSLAISDHAAFVLRDSAAVYFVGGYDSAYTAQTAMYKWEPVTVNNGVPRLVDTFEPEQVAGGDLSVARGDLSVAVVNNTVYAVGGFTHYNNFTAPLNVCCVVRPKSLKERKGEREKERETETETERDRDRETDRDRERGWGRRRHSLTHSLTHTHTRALSHSLPTNQPTAVCRWWRRGRRHPPTAAAAAAGHVSPIWALHVGTRPLWSHTGIWLCLEAS